MAGLPPLPPNVNQIAAPLLYGLLLNWLLYGILSVQAYVYHCNFPADKWIYKVLVYGLFALETLQTALSGVDAYYWFASGYGNINHLSNPYFSAFDSPMLSSVIALIVQFFFCHRIWKMEKRLWPLSLFIAAISLMQASGGFANAIMGHEIASFDASFKTVPVAVLYLWLVGDAAADVMIAVTVVCLLWRARSTEHDRTSTILAKWIQLTMETNAATAAVALLAVFLHIGFPNNSYFICPTMIIGRLYSNSLYLTLNNRLSFQNMPVHNTVSPSASSDRSALPKPIRMSRGSRSFSSTGGEGSPAYIIDTFNNGKTAGDIGMDVLTKSQERSFA